MATDADMLASLAEGLSAAIAAGRQPEEAAARLRLSEARLALREVDMALREARSAEKLFRELGDVSGAAEAQLALCNAHLGKIVQQTSQGAFASRVDSLAAVQAAKSAYASLADAGGEAAARAGDALSRALLASGVPANSLPRPEVLMQTRDVSQLVSDLGGLVSPFHAPPLNIRAGGLGGRETKAAGGVHYERSNFRWKDPSQDYSYQLIWEPCRALPPRAPRTSTTMLAQGARSAALPLYHALQPRDPATAAAAGEPLCVHVSAADSSTNYGSSLMGSLQTVSAMVTAKLRRLTFVQLGEAPPLESKDSANARAARQVAMSPCTLALLRTARIEAPQMSIGFVAGDAASWMSSRDELVSAIFDTHNANGETELMWSRGQAMMPTLLQKAMPEPILRRDLAPHER